MKKQQKKILFLIHTLGGGGAEKVLVNLVNNMDYKKYDITVMTLLDVGELRYNLNKEVKYKTTIKLRKNKKVKTKDKSGSLLNKSNKFIILIAKMYALMWKCMPTKLLYKIFVKEKYDYEISFLEGISAKFISSSSNKDSKKYAWIHVDLINQTKSSNVFKNIKDEIKCYNKFDNIICVSKVVKEQFIKKYNIDEDKVLVKYNSIDKNEIISKSKEKCSYVKDNKSILLCSIGRLNGQKAYDRLLRVFKKLLDDKFKIKLIIIGEGTSKDELENYIKENDMGNYVKLLGFKSNPYKYLKQSDLFVCSSKAEGFSTVVTESIILGIPVVTTDCSGMKEMLGENNEYGIVTENDEESLYEGIKKLLSNKELFEYYKKQVKKRANFFDLKNSVKEVERLFSD